MQVTSPSSSATTPSPPLQCLHPSDAPDALQLADLEPQEREERQRAVQKLLARAEYSKLTRGLRARLAYASFKATNNLSHIPLPVLEDRIHEPSPSPSPAPAPLSPYSALHKRRADMAPPVSPSHSLYSSLLGPPPSKRPRHLYGAAAAVGAGPTPADLLPSYAPTTPRKAAPSSPRHTPHAHSPFGDGGQGRTVHTVLQGRARSTVTEKEDMNAAATLTALMFNRPSPRQRGEDGGPRTTTPAPSLEHKPTEDADAAELMLYLATSPSPARPTTVVRRAPSSMGRVLFAGAGAAKYGEKDYLEGAATPALSVGQSSLPSSQETIDPPSQLLPPPPSPSLSIVRSPPVDSLKGKKSSPFDVSRRLFVDNDDSHRIGELREGGGGRFSLGKGIDLVEAK